MKVRCVGMQPHPNRSSTPHSSSGNFQILGKYEALRLNGYGGFGLVVQLKNKRAVKMMKVDGHNHHEALTEMHTLADIQKKVGEGKRKNLPELYKIVLVGGHTLRRNKAQSALSAQGLRLLHHGVHQWAHSVRLAHGNKVN